MEDEQPKKSNILVWILLVGHLNTSSVLQCKLASSCVSLSICPFCLQHGEDPINLFFLCPYSVKCWETLFSVFNMSWVFEEDCRDLVRQLLGGPCFNKTSRLIWFNAVKAILAKLWFERNQRVFFS